RHLGAGPWPGDHHRFTIPGRPDDQPIGTAAQLTERVVVRHDLEARAGPTRRDGGDESKHASRIASPLDSTTPGSVALGKSRQPACGAATASGHQALYLDVVELAPVSQHSGEDQRLARDVRATKVIAWIGLGHPEPHGLVDRLGEVHPALDRAEHEPECP